MNVRRNLIFDIKTLTLMPHNDTDRPSQESDVRCANRDGEREAHGALGRGRAGGTSGTTSTKQLTDSQDLTCYISKSNSMFNLSLVLCHYLCTLKVWGGGVGVGRLPGYASKVVVLSLR